MGKISEPFAVNKSKLSGKLHKILGLVLIPLLLLFAISGIGLNHPSLIESIAVPVKSLPHNYHFKNWNRGAIQTSAQASSDDVFVAGKNGLGKLTNNHYQQIDNPLASRPWHNFIYSLHLDKATEQLFVGSRDGLFRYNIANSAWHYYPATQGQRIVSIGLDTSNQHIVAIANHQIFQLSHGNQNNVSRLNIKLAESQQDVPLFRFIFALHSGEIWGLFGILLMDLVALAVIYFSLSGLYYWLFPKLVRRKLLSRKNKIKGGRIFRWLAKNHNSWGLALMPLLLVSAATAMVMRPPGLILIASSASPVAVYPSHGNDSIPYKITKAAFVNGQLVLLTDDGVFAGKAKSGQTFNPIEFSAPIHGMGATLFQAQNNGNLLIGSFSGLFSWQASDNSYHEVTLAEETNGLMPMAVHQNGDDVIVFDYFRGKLFDQNQQFAPMPDSVNNSAKMALWNFFFELHNLRIFQYYIGNFYLLVLLLASLAFVIVTVTGTIQYLRKK